MLKERSMVEINCYDVYLDLIIEKQYGTEYTFTYNKYGIDTATFIVCPDINLVQYSLSMSSNKHTNLVGINNHFEFIQIVKAIFTHLLTYGLEYVRQK